VSGPQQKTKRPPRQRRQVRDTQSPTSLGDGGWKITSSIFSAKWVSLPLNSSKAVLNFNTNLDLAFPSLVKRRDFKNFSSGLLHSVIKM
jgi:hypothetical protein